MRFIAAVATAFLICAATVFADTNVSGSITSNTTWAVSGSPYIVTGDVTVNSNVTLTIDPGVTVKFNNGRQLSVNGTLSAVGTGTSPIVFTSSSATPSAGDWNTLRFSSGSSASHVTYASILYGGASQFAAVAVDNSSPSFDQVTISNSSTSAMRVTGSNAVPTVTNSTLSSNAWAGVEVTASNGLTVSGTTWSGNGDYPIVADVNASLLDLTNLTATGNGGGVKNAIGVRGGTINADLRWRLSALPWEVTNNIDVSTNITLTIDPGVTVKFASGKQLGVLGKLTAVGTSGSPITFTSNAASPTPGSWNTIWFKSGSLSTSQISYASVLYAGNYYAGIFVDNSSPTLDHVTVSNSSAEGIRVTGSTAAPTIANCTLSSNAGYGINVTNGGGPTSATVSGTTFTNNGNYAIGAEANALLLDLSNLTATGNGSGAKDSIGYRGGVISTAERWPNSALPREVTSTVQVSNPGMSGSLIIDPGVTVKFGPDKALNVMGTLTANGTADAPITFTSSSSSPVPGSWNSIHYFAGSSASQMSYATVVYSGNSWGGIFIENSSPTFDHVTVSSSRTAVYVNGVSAPVFHHCQFIGDTAGINNTNGSEQIDATLCYWNAATGPSGLGGGSGYSASGYVSFDPWLTVAPSSAQYISGVTVQSRVFNPALSVFSTVVPSFAISGDWTVTILDATASTVLRTYTGTGTSASVTWDGKDSGGTLQPAGSYRFQIANTAPGNLVAATARGVLTLSNAAYVPTTAITSVTSGQTLSNVYQNGSADVSVVGSVRSTTLRNWILDYGAGSTPASWTTLQSGTTEVNAAQIYLWPTIPVTNGPYVLRLRSWDTAGNYSLVSLPITMGNFQVTQPVYELNVANSVTYTSIIPFALTQTVTLKNSAGSVVRTLVNAASRTAGTSTDSWNGRSDAGGVLPDGLYYVIASVTDGSHSMTWDQSSQFFTTNPIETHTTFGSFDPFNNQPLTYTYSTTYPSKNTIFMSTVTGYVPNTCSAPAFCFTKYEQSGSHTMSWAGVDLTGAFRPDIKTLAIVMFRNQFPLNGIVLFGTKPTISNLAVTPSVASVGATQSLTFTLGTYQSQTAAVSVAFQNQSSLSTLRTISVPSQTPGNVSIAWDGRADNGMLVAPGFYTVTVTVTDGIGNQVSRQILTTIQN
jgi:parallel beta-helix repeat protein